MIAEWLATGRGLGNLLNQSRGYLDFGMIWTVAAVSVLLSVGFYLAGPVCRTARALPNGDAICRMTPLCQRFAPPALRAGRCRFEGDLSSLV